MRRVVALADLAEELAREPERPQQPTTASQRRRERRERKAEPRPTVTPRARLCTSPGCADYGTAPARPGGWSCTVCTTRLEALAARITAEHKGGHTHA